MRPGGEVIDITGQPYPQSGLFGIDNMNTSWVEIIDNDSQRSPRSNQCDHYDMNVFRGEGYLYCWSTISP